MNELNLNKDERVALSLVMCMPVEEAMTVVDLFGMDGAVLVMVFDSYLFYNKLKVAYYDNLKNLAYRCYGSKGIKMLQKLVRVKVYDLLKISNHDFIFSECQNRFFLDDARPCESDICRLINIRKKDFDSNFFKMKDKYKERLADYLNELEEELPQYVIERMCNRDDDAGIYKIILQWLRHSLYFIGARTDINILADRLNMKRKVLLDMLKRDGIVVFDKEERHFFAPQMRLCMGMDAVPSDKELYEVRKNYDLRHISFNLITNNYEKRI